MAGFLSTMFGGDEGGTQASQSGTTGDEAMNGSDGQETESSTQTHEVSAGDDLHLAPEVSIHSEMGGTYENADGSTTTWERTDDVTLTTDTHIVTSVNAILTTEDSETF